MPRHTPYCVTQSLLSEPQASALSLGLHSTTRPHWSTPSSSLKSDWFTMSSYATNLPPTRISSHLMAFDPNTPAEDVVKIVAALPELPPSFFIPRLDDRPQNPIMDTLRLWSRPSHGEPFNLLVPQVIADHFETEGERLVDKRENVDVWTRAATEPRKPAVSLLQSVIS